MSEIELAFDRYGFPKRGRGNEPTRLSVVGAKEPSRTQKWLTMVASEPNKYRVMRSRVFIRRVKKGIPHDLRGNMWTTMLLDITDDDKREAEALLKRPHHDLESSTEGREALDSIHKDLARTFPTHIRFGQKEGQDALLNVLAAYAATDLEVGYCQGMSFIAALFLMFLDETQALCCLRRVMTKPMWSMRDLYKPRMPAVGLRMFQFDRVLYRACRHVHAHFVKVDFQHSMYATHWFTTIFTYNFPFVLVLRVWDIFLLDGWPIVIGTAVALWRLNKKATLKIASFEEMFDFLKQILLRIDEDAADALVKEALWVVRWYMSGSELRNLELEYQRNGGKVQ